MRATRLTLGAAALLVGVTLMVPKADASTGPSPLDCNRACLEGLGNQYLTAVVAHTPAGLPLSKDVVYTENNQVLEIGDGYWKTAEGRGAYSHYFADPQGGQVACMGTMKEAGGLLLLSPRLGIELGRITEIESVYFKPGGGGPNNIAFMDAYKPEAFWFTTDKPKATRAQLIAAADSYFSGLQKNDGKGVLSNGKAFEFKGFNRPSSILATEAFLMENNKIRRVEIVGNSAAYHMNSAWPGNLSGN